jgi:hypothetical protein
MGSLHRDVGVNNIPIFRAGAETIDVPIDYDPSRTTLEQTTIRNFIALDLIKDALVPHQCHHTRRDIEPMFGVLVWFALACATSNARLDCLYPSNLVTAKLWISYRSLHSVYTLQADALELEMTRSMYSVWFPCLKRVLIFAHPP